MDVNDLSFSFKDKYSGRCIFVFIDTPHMLKLIRNLLGEKDLIIDGFDQPAKWSDIVNLVEWEEANGWRAGSKLTWKYVKYDRYKMKVILAAQVFSNSTADALDYLRLDLKEQAFANSAATADFCRRVNDAFDLLNYRKGQKICLDA